MTYLEQIKRNKNNRLLNNIAALEKVNIDILAGRLISGEVVIPHNKNRKVKKICGIGKDLKTKVNANIGTSSQSTDFDLELKKLKVAIKSCVDTVMDLSTGGELGKIRRLILENSTVPVGTVPIYEASITAIRKRGSIAKLSIDDIFKTFESHAKDGVDFFTVHSGVTKDSLARLEKEDRIIDIVSRGAAFLANWMHKTKKENPLYEEFDVLVDIAARYDVTLSLGDGLRPGSVCDANDRAQIQELILLGELAQRANEKGVQVIIEGPGHVPIDKIFTNIKLQKDLCDNRPFYVLGPIVTDVAPGYDHITAAIGGALAASFGADFLCYVTASEHLRIPSIEDVREAVIVCRIAAHAADIAKGLPQALEWDRDISKARFKRDWNDQIRLALDPYKAKILRRGLQPDNKDVCSMCGEFCSMKLIDELH